MQNCTVADEIAFASLPLEVQALAKRVLCDVDVEEELLEEAFEEGYNSAIDSIEFHMPSYNYTTFKQWYASKR